MLILPIDEQMTPKQKELLSLLVNYDMPRFFSSSPDYMISFDGTKYRDLLYVKERIESLYKQRYMTFKPYSDISTLLREVVEEAQ